ncbi:MAG: tRNA threonylcarbamoyladenosine dehydratase [Bacteroidaceae bacterium]|nr:tRNA threonylcarbamoyladenosine dehydratase [Bacteroidaceae bacterium]
MANANCRTELLLGHEAVEKLNGANVLCVGTGGVGGHVAEMLARAGIGHMTIIDGDRVDESNMNRQIAATADTVGMEKVNAMKKRLLAVNPRIEVTAINRFITDSDIEPILSATHFDYIADAIDSVGVKCRLIEKAFEFGIPIISSMGAGARTDISKIHIDKLAGTHHDGLAKAVRKRIHNAKISNSLDVVFSDEEPNRNGIAESDNGSRKTIVGTVSWIPAAFGCHMAGHIVMKLTQK